MDKLANKLVLIVDDDDRNIFALSSYLGSFDLRIISAENGEDAITLLREGARPDIILLDIMMPIMDGYETLAVLKQDDELKKIPVVAVTARAMKGDREKCMEAGAWDYVSKPVDLTILMEKINKWIL
ncbi:MAG: response regulator [Chitinophagaceae bacterium]